MHSASTYAQSSSISISCTKVIYLLQLMNWFVVTDLFQLIMIHHYHPKSTVYMKFTPVSSTSLNKCLMTCVNYCRIIQNHCSKNAPLARPMILPFFLTPGPTDLHSSIFSEWQVSGFIQYVEFSHWLLSLGNMHLCFP